MNIDAAVTRDNNSAGKNAILVHLYDSDGRALSVVAAVTVVLTKIKCKSLLQWYKLSPV